MQPQSIQVDPNQHPDSPDQGQSGGGDFDAAIDKVLADLRAAISAPDASPQDKLTVEKVTTLLQGIKAQHDKEQQAALGGGPATNYLRRATGGAAGG